MDIVVVFQNNLMIMIMIMIMFFVVDSRTLIFVFTALADEYNVGRISEVHFVRAETCSHPNKVYYVAQGSAVLLVYVYTMDVVQ